MAFYFNVLTIGDIIGDTGKNALNDVLPALVRDEHIHLVIANGENLSGGMGISSKCYTEIYNLGVDVVTMGNHVWRNKDIFNLIKQGKLITRPANYPLHTVGKEYVIIEKMEKKVAVSCLLGRSFMEPLDCPFMAAKRLIDKFQHEQVDYIFIEIHGEATAEKIAMGWWLDGQASVVYGTHTHVQTADEHLLPQGTGYITDLGMTGPKDSVIGIKVDRALKRFTKRMPASFEVAHGTRQFNGAVWQFRDDQLIGIKRINLFNTQEYNNA